MSEQGWLALFSILLIMVSLGGVGWLVATGQAFTLEGLFLVLTFGVIALVFGVVLKYLVGN